MGVTRHCSKTGCTSPAVSTLTYVYSDRAAALGPLATYAEPHTYDLCARHAEGLTAPKGWQVIRASGAYAPRLPCPDDLLALADAVREVSGPRAGGPPRHAADRPRPEAGDHSWPEAGDHSWPEAGDHSWPEAGVGVVEVARRGHLRVLRDS